MVRVKSKNELLVIGGVNLVDYYNHVVVPLDSKFRPMSESRAVGLCPFHHDTDPSFHFWKKKNIYHCFGCGFGGDVVRTHIKLRREYFGEKLSVEKAVAQLATLFGIELDEENGDIVLSPFERAKQLMFDKDEYVIPKGVMSIAEFRQLNNRVKRSNVSLKVKLANFEQLDLIVSVVLSEK